MLWFSKFYGFISWGTSTALIEALEENTKKDVSWNFIASNGSSKQHQLSGVQIVTSYLIVQLYRNHHRPLCLESVIDFFLHLYKHTIIIRSINSHSVKRLQPRNRPMLPPMSAEEEEQFHLVIVGVASRTSFCFLPHMIIFSLSDWSRAVVNKSSYHGRYLCSFSLQNARRYW